MPNSPETPRYGWVAVDRDGTEHWFTGGSTKPPPPPPTPTKPMTLRMFVDDCSGTGLWPDWAWDYPDSPFAYLFDDEPETLLPISEQLRDGIRAWVEEYTASIGHHPMNDPEHIEHDRRGFRLSQH